MAGNVIAFHIPSMYCFYHLISKTLSPRFQKRELMGYLLGFLRERFSKSIENNHSRVIYRNGNNARPVKEVPLLAILTRNISSNFPPEFLSIREYNS